MSVSELESYDLIRFAEGFEERLRSAEQQLATQGGLEAEKGWMETSVGLVSAARAGSQGLLARVRHLPELAEVRDEFAADLQNAWVDALEKLHAGITFSSSSRAPVIEALFPHLKFPVLRRTTPEGGTDFQAELERRHKTSYVTRILIQEEFAMVRPVVEQVIAAFGEWKACLSPMDLPAEEAQPLKVELVAMGDRLELALRQARLLAEAALLPLPEIFDSAGLGAKPRRRAGRAVLEAPETEEALLVQEFASEAAAPDDVAPPSPASPDLPAEAQQERASRKARKKAAKVPEVEP